MKKLLFISTIFLIPFLFSSAGYLFADSSQDKRLEKTINKITKKLEKILPSKQGVLVMDFRDQDGGVSEFGRYLSERIHINLGNSERIQIVDRKSMDGLFKEKKLSDTGLIDEKTAIDFGKQIGAETVIYGTLTELKKYLSLNIRIVDIENGLLVGGTSYDIKKTKKVDALIDSFPKRYELVQQQNDESEIKEAKKNENNPGLRELVEIDYLKAVIRSVSYFLRIGVDTLAVVDELSTGNKAEFYMTLITLDQSLMNYWQDAKSEIKDYLQFENEKRYVGLRQLYDSYENLIKIEKEQMEIHRIFYRKLISGNTEDEEWADAMSRNATIGPRITQQHKYIGESIYSIFIYQFDELNFENKEAVSSLYSMEGKSLIDEIDRLFTKAQREDKTLKSLSVMGEIREIVEEAMKNGKEKKLYEARRLTESEKETTRRRKYDEKKSFVAKINGEAKMNEEDRNEYLRRMDFDKKLWDFRLANVDENRRGLFSKATDAYQEGYYETAIRYWEKLLELEPNHVLSKQKIRKAQLQLKKVGKSKSSLVGK